MASIPHTVLTSDKVGPTQEISGKVFFLKDGLDQPCDVTLVVRDGEFKAHRKVLSEASPFFEKLLNSDMKECKEGVVRLEIFTDSLMRSTLEFIYTGNVQILDEDEARDLIMLADYLLLPNLKILAAQVYFINVIFQIVFQFSVLPMNITARNLSLRQKLLPSQISLPYSLIIVRMF